MSHWIRPTQLAAAAVITKGKLRDLNYETYFNSRNLRLVITKVKLGDLNYKTSFKSRNLGLVTTKVKLGDLNYETYLGLVI